MFNQVQPLYVCMNGKFIMVITVDWQIYFSHLLLLDPGSLIDSSNIGMNVFLFIFGKI